MAKLNKMEISAIASKIVDDVNSYNQGVRNTLYKKEYQKWLTDFRRTEEYKNLVKFEELSKKVAEYTKDFGWSYRVSSLKVSDESLKDIFEKEHKDVLKFSPLNGELVERDIIIAQAKNEDLESLINELTSKYKIV